MSLVYKLHNAQITIILFAAFFAAHANAIAQNVTAPYSTLGIGEIDSKNAGRYSISGSASVSRRNGNSYNDANPASLTSLGIKLINFDLLGRGRASTFQEKETDPRSAVSKDFVIRNVALSLRPHAKTGYAFGLRPFSSVNYKYPLPDAIYNTQTSGYSRSVEGTGGINEAYGSFGYALSKNLSAGITASYLFGSTQKTTSYYDESLYLDIKKDEYQFYTGGKVLAGLQYYTDVNKPWQHTIGFTASAITDLKGYDKIEYISADSTLFEESKGRVSFKMPVSGGLGYTASNKRGLSISAEGNYYYWPKQLLSYNNTYTSPSVRLSVGWEYTKVGKYFLNDATFEQYYLGMGLTTQNSYYHLNGNKVWDYAVTFGGGYNISGSLYVHAGLELGYRGNYTVGQIKERYTQFTLGFTVRSLWYKASRSDE